MIYVDAKRYAGGDTEQDQHKEHETKDSISIAPLIDAVLMGIVVITIIVVIVLVSRWFYLYVLDWDNFLSQLPQQFVTLQ